MLSEQDLEGREHVKTGEFAPEGEVGPETPPVGTLPENDGQISDFDPVVAKTEDTGDELTQSEVEAILSDPEAQVEAEWYEYDHEDTKLICVEHLRAKAREWRSQADFISTQKAGNQYSQASLRWAADQLDLIANHLNRMPEGEYQEVESEDESGDE